MKTLKYSLAALLALGTFNYALAEETANQEATQEVVDKSVPVSTKTSILDALKGTTVGGYAYGMLTSMFGDDANGTAFRVRTQIDLNTGSFHGFSIGTRLFASIGGGAPNGGSFLANSGNPNTMPTIGMYALYGRQTFQSSATVITGGKINIVSPFSDGAWDYGYGLAIDNYDIEGIGFHLQGFGAWALDNGNEIWNGNMTVDANATLENLVSGDIKNNIANLEKKIKKKPAKNSALASDRGLFVFGVSGDKKKLSNVGFEAWVAHAIKTIDFLAFADLNYTIAGVKIQGQLAATQVDTSSELFNVSNPDTSKDITAKLRGLYNIQLAYNGDSGASVAVGYTGSFGDGYGALLNATASFNMGGKIWYDTISSGANGFGIAGSGGQKHPDGRKTDIQVAYLSVGYKGIKNLGMSLDYAYVGGNNNYMLMKKGLTNHLTKTINGRMDATMHEVSFSASYAFSEKLSLSGIIGSTFGDLEMGRARLKLNYSF